MPMAAGKWELELDDSKQIVSVSRRKRRKFGGCRMAARSWAGIWRAGTQHQPITLGGRHAMAVELGR